METKTPPAVKNLLKRIGSGEGVRRQTLATTIEFALDRGLIENVGGEWRLTSVGAAEIAPFKAQEFAYRLPKRDGTMGDWKRKIVKTQSAHESFVDSLIERGAEFEARDAD